MSSLVRSPVNYMLSAFSFYFGKKSTSQEDPTALIDRHPTSQEKLTTLSRKRDLDNPDIPDIPGNPGNPTKKYKNTLSQKVPKEYYKNIYENEANFRKYIDRLGVDLNQYIFELTGGNCKDWNQLKFEGSESFKIYGIKPDDNDKVNSIFELYAAFYPDGVGFNMEHFELLKRQCPDKFFSINDGGNKPCPDFLRRGGYFIYKLIYNRETKVYTLHFFGDCDDPGCKNVSCMGEGGRGPFVKGISVDHYYIYREGSDGADEGVVMAGQVSILGGIATFDNGSGHYRPNPISPDIENVIRRIMDKFSCEFDDISKKGGKKQNKKRKNNKKTKRRKPRSKVRSKKSKTKRVRKIR